MIDSSTQRTSILRPLKSYLLNVMFEEYMQHFDRNPIPEPFYCAYTMHVLKMQFRASLILVGHFSLKRIVDSDKTLSEF